MFSRAFMRATPNIMLDTLSRGTAEYLQTSNTLLELGLFWGGSHLHHPDVKTLEEEERPVKVLALKVAYEASAPPAIFTAYGAKELSTVTIFVSAASQAQVQNLLSAGDISSREAALLEDIGKCFSIILEALPEGMSGEVREVQGSINERIQCFMTNITERFPKAMLIPIFTTSEVAMMVYKPDQARMMEVQALAEVQADGRWLLSLMELVEDGERKEQEIMNGMTGAASQYGR